jgi:mannose-6-phosphate isomerase-like protein (cupin superfamily)
MNPPAVLFTLQAARNDPALQARGARKLLVTEIYPAKEEPAADSYWRHDSGSGKCPVLLMPDAESAVFTQLARQTRHRHLVGTEIYLLLEGRMSIEVEGVDYTLAPGDALVVQPGAYHEVRREGEFLCRVFTLHCGGAQDRHEA